MWTAYVGNGNGVAVQTSFIGLCASIAPPYDRLMQFGLVRYLDYDLETFSSLGPLDPYFHKQSQYKNEAELRILVQHFPREAYSDRAWSALETAADLNWTAQIRPPELNLDIKTKGHLRIPIRMDHLLRRLVLSPRSSPEFQKYVLGAANVFGTQAMRSCLE